MIKRNSAHTTKLRLCAELSIRKALASRCLSQMIGCMIAVKKDLALILGGQAILWGNKGAYCDSYQSAFCNKLDLPSDMAAG